MSLKEKYFTLLYVDSGHSSLNMPVQAIKNKGEKIEVLRILYLSNQLLTFWSEI